jgi:hypothetical protein
MGQVPLDSQPSFVVLREAEDLLLARSPSNRRNGFSEVLSKSRPGKVVIFL